MWVKSYCCQIKILHTCSLQTVDIVNEHSFEFEKIWWELRESHCCKVNLAHISPWLSWLIKIFFTVWKKHQLQNNVAARQSIIGTLVVEIKSLRIKAGLQ